MADAWEVKIRAALIAELNDPARTWQTPTVLFTATKKWLPVYQPADLNSLKVAVTVIELEETRITRGGKETMDYMGVIGIQQQVDHDDDAAMDVLTKIAEDVHEFFRAPHHLATLTEAGVFEAKRPTIYDLDMLEEQHTWITWIGAKVRVNR